MVIGIGAAFCDLFIEIFLDAWIGFVDEVKEVTLGVYEWWFFFYYIILTVLINLNFFSLYYQATDCEYTRIGIWSRIKRKIIRNNHKNKHKSIPIISQPHTSTKNYHIFFVLMKR